MANNRLVCLFIAFFCCAGTSFARQLPKECSAGPTYWCSNLSQAAACGAVGHCTSTVWEMESPTFDHNDVTNEMVKLFRELKDIKELINQEYLSIRVGSACRDFDLPVAAKVCKENTAQLEQYLYHVLTSATSAETMCKVIGICGNDKITNALALKGKKQPTNDKHKTLLGGEKCTWGPSYWCSNITTGHECRATHHCVERVWSKMQVAEDTDSICKICTDMVKQARDQLESNQTQEDLKAVFEGSCRLIPIKLVANECMKMADEFVPDLVETLASQMNPQVVCSVAGLCNNDKIDKLLIGYNAALEQHKQCSGCHQAVTGLRKRFDDTSYFDFLQGLLTMCRKMDSLSDSCSMLVFKYYEDIVAAVKHDLKPQPICHLSGQCVHLYHSHDEYVFPKETSLKATDDVPCEFCEQLVVHLRDILVANTTELQFYKVLTGLCKQTGNFKSECLHLVEQYYPMIYNYLVSDLKPQELCTLMGVCGKKEDMPIAPLLPKELTVKAITSEKIGKVSSVPVATKQTNVRIMGPEAAEVLPVERMFIKLPESNTECSFCQYFLHYLQVELSDIKTEEQIKSVVEHACSYLPQSVSGQCRTFVSQYGPAVVALLVQDIDPSSVCPALGMCPSVGEVKRVAVNEGKSNCPLCLFAVEQLEAMLQNNRTETSIRAALDSLCTHLSQKLRTECTDFVDTYSHQLIEMLIADMNAQEICVFLKLCADSKPDPLGITRQTVQDRLDMYHRNPTMRGDWNRMKKGKQKTTNPEYTLDIDGVIETNEIPDHTVNGRPVEKPKPACVVCEFVMKEIDAQITDKHNDDEIKKAVEGVCKRMPKSVRQECTEFVDKYADLIVSLLAQSLDADEVCRELRLCDATLIKQVKEQILDCAVCETVVMAVKKVLKNNKVDHDIVHIIEKSCALLPAKYNDRCHTLMEVYGDSVIHILEEYGAKAVCNKIGLCAARQYLNMYHEGKQ